MFCRCVLNLILLDYIFVLKLHVHAVISNERHFTESHDANMPSLPYKPKLSVLSDTEGFTGRLCQEAGTVMSFTHRANALELSKHTRPNLQTLRRLLTMSTHDVLLVLPLTHSARLTTWCLNLPPGREWKRCQSLFTVAHTRAEVVDREVTRSSV